MMPSFLLQQLVLEPRLYWVVSAFFFVLGLLFGSFANVVIARLPQGRSVVRPGSSCPSCGNAIRWHDNVPVLSWVLLRARCRSCGVGIPVRYPVVELLGGFLFLAAWLHLGREVDASGFVATLVRDLGVMVILLAVTFIDLDHRIIPDELSLGGAAFVLLLSPFAVSPGWQGALLGAGIGFGVFYAFASLYQAIRGEMGLGGGDIKLLALLGGWLGLPGVMTTILVSSVLGSIVGLGWGLALRFRRRDAETEGAAVDSLMRLSIPYGPFLVVGALFFHFFRRMPWLQFMIPI